MSRKTRKLIWSAPLVAALAVVGALAIFAALAPGGVLAHEPDATSAPHVPPDAVTGIDVTTPSVANGGRNSLRVTWNAPAMGDPVAEYRVDISTDTDVWMNVIGGEASSADLTESVAMANCTSDDDGDRCYTATGLESDTLYHFRVFAMNQFGTSPISVDETLGSGRTLPIDPPAKVAGLHATDYYEDKIVVSWDGVQMTGGADVLWYCIGVASSPSGMFTDLTDLTDMDAKAACLEKEEATAAAEADDKGVYTSPVDISTLIDSTMTDVPQTIVVAAKDEDGNAVTSYTHLGLHTPEVIELRYRLYAVTDEDGDAKKSVDDRRISRAASETATGKTVPPANKPDALRVAPPAVGNLRAVAYTTSNASPLPDPNSSNQGLHFFWTHPEGYDPDFNDDNMFTDPNWHVQVQRRVPTDMDHDDYPGWQFVPSASPDPLATGYGTPQFSVLFGQSQDLSNSEYGSPILWGDSPSDRRYRVRYLNPGSEAGTEKNKDTTDDVAGAWAEITIPEVTTNYYRNDDVPDVTSTLPIIALSASANMSPGLRFEFNDDNPRDHIDLLWNRDTSGRMGQNQPNGYVIDRSADDGMTWQVLERADTPTDLGTADTFTDSPRGEHKVVPGKKYTYRVFPVFIESGPDAYGIPALIEANSRGADLPEAARSVRATADGQNACLITWTPPSDDGGHEVMGYLIRIAPDDNGNPGKWEAINIVDGTAPFTVAGGAMTEFTYTGTTKQLGAGKEDELSAGAVRWFQVIPITIENDGVNTTGGAVLDEMGAMNDPQNGRGATVPMDEDAERAVPVKCTTAGLGDAPQDKATMPPQKPVDLTAEAASDTNALADSARGVFLTWNEQLKGDASETESYRIYRKRMDTGVDALNDDDWRYLTRVFDVTSYTDETELRQNEETRMYQVCSEATGVTDPECVAMPVEYALHPADHVIVPAELTAPTNVMATVDDSDPGSPAIEVTWTDGANAVGGHLVLLFSSDFTEVPGIATPTASGMYTFTGTDTGEAFASGAYVAVVVAIESRSNYLYGYDIVTVP